MELTEGMAIGKVVMATISLVTVCLCGCGSGGRSDAVGTDEVPPSYTVNFSAGPNGTLAGSASQRVLSGRSTTAVTAVPSAGYHFVNWTGDNGFLTTSDNPLTVGNVTASQNIRANFASDPGNARLKLMSSGSLPAGKSLSGIRVKIQLPAGVAVSADAGNAVDPGVVTPSGAAAASSLNFVGYTPATPTTPAALEFLIISHQAGGFGVGEFATVNCVLAAGVFPSAADFVIPEAYFQPADLQLQPVTTLTATLTVSLY